MDDEKLFVDRGGEDERPIRFDAAHVAGRGRKGEGFTASMTCCLIRLANRAIRDLTWTTPETPADTPIAGIDLLHGTRLWPTAAVPGAMATWSGDPVPRDGHRRAVTTFGKLAMVCCWPRQSSPRCGPASSRPGGPVAETVRRREMWSGDAGTDTTPRYLNQVIPAAHRTGATRRRVDQVDHGLFAGVHPPGLGNPSGQLHTSSKHRSNAITQMLADARRHRKTLDQVCVRVRW